MACITCLAWLNAEGQVKEIISYFSVVYILENFLLFCVVDIELMTVACRTDDEPKYDEVPLHGEDGYG